MRGEELVGYIVQGIPDRWLRDLARAQAPRTTDDLLRSFASITLWERTTSVAQRRSGGRTTAASSSVWHWNDERLEGRCARAEATTFEAQGRRHCFNCGEANRVGAECPTRGQGPK